MNIIKVIMIISLLLVLLSQTKYVASTIIKSIIEKQRVTISNNNNNNNNNNVIIKTISIFEKGAYKIENNIKVEKSESVGPPKDLRIVCPTKEGNYPVLLFIHGTMLSNDFYLDFFQHVASHGFIVVAPQLYLQWIPCQSEEIEDAVSVTNWLPSNLDTILPTGVTSDLTKLTISGHSRGAKTAFALALGVYQTNLNTPISALVAIDPVAGPTKSGRTKPYLLTYIPDSFNLSIPATVIGTGLGNKTTILGLSCAPNEVNHDEFYSECTTATHFVLADYGHNDLLDDDIWLKVPYGLLAKGMCASGGGRGGPMRRSLGGIVVGFLDYAFNLPGADQFVAVLNDPELAPAKLYPVEYKGDMSMVEKV